MDFALTEQQELIRKEVATLARSFSLEYWREKDRTADYPWEFVRAFAAGGWLGVVIYFVFSPITYFLVPNEMEKMYAADGWPCPVKTTTGLWVLLPIVGWFVWFVKMQRALNEFWIARGAPAPG